MTEDIRDAGVRHVSDVQGVNRDLIEKALRMRCVSYLAGVKAELLTETIFEVDSSKKVLRNANKELSGHLETIEQQRRELAREVAEREAAQAEAMAAKRAAEAANEAKTLFLANVTHELRSPLFALLNFAELLVAEATDPRPSDTERMKECVEYMRRSGQTLSDLVDDLLDISGIEMGQVTLAEAQTDLGAVVAECREIAEPRARAGGISLRCEVPAGFPRLQADARRLKQIVCNLLENAIKFTPAGGEVTLTAGLGAGNEAEIRIADTGVGIAAEDIETALSPFRQLADPADEAREGMGLGLPLAKAFTELHGGTLTITSKPGEGTTVTVRLPRERTLPGTSTEAAGGP